MVLGASVPATMAWHCHPHLAEGPSRATVTSLPRSLPRGQRQVSLTGSLIRPWPPRAVALPPGMSVPY